MSSVVVPPLHPRCRYHVDYIGNEKTPVLIVDDFLEQTHFLIETAASQCQFGESVYFYPGLQGPVPPIYAAAMSTHLRKLICDVFQIRSEKITHSKSHFAMVLTPPEELRPTQSRPHVDSNVISQLASVHYLCDVSHGGTSLYRHKATGFERVDESRREEYDKYLAIEAQDTEWQKKYINGTNKYYEQIASYDAVFNRLIMYRGNNLHSANIAPDFTFDPNPRTGRLTLTTFIHSYE